MRAAGHAIQVLSLAEEAVVHRNVLRIADEVGLQVEHDGLLDRLAAIGGRVDRARRRATFSPAATEEFIASAERFAWDEVTPLVGGSAIVYYGHYLDPATDEFLPMTVDRARQYFQVAGALPGIGKLGMLGCPLSGTAIIPSGLLAIDEVYSPVQLVIDDELIGALAQFAREYEVSDESIAVDLIEAVGPGGTFVAEPHTARWFRRELWEPGLWSRQTFARWRETDGRIDVERARERALAFLAVPLAPSAISDDEASRLQRVVNRAIS